MLNLSRWQAMHTWCLASGTQSLRAGGCSGGWNLAEESALFPSTRSLSLSELFEDAVCEGVLPGNTQPSNRSVTRFRRTALINQLRLSSPAEGVGESIRPEDCEDVSWAGHCVRASWRLITESEIDFIVLDVSYGVRRSSPEAKATD